MVSRTDMEILQLAANNGIIDFEMCRRRVTAMKRKELLEKHQFKIWQGTDSYWRTYLPDDSKKTGRRLVKRREKLDIENILVKYYRQKSENPTFKEVFNLWINEKVECKEIAPATVSKYINDYKRFCSGKPIENVRFKYLTESELRLFIKRTIADMNLTAKSYSGLRLIIKGMLKYGKWEELTTISAEEFFGDINIGKNSFRKKIKDKSKEVFTDEEVRMITHYISENPTIRNLAILLAFQTGVRVGELASLKRGDINFKSKTLHIQRTEVTFKDLETGKSVNKVREYPKNENADRYLILQDKAINTLRQVLKLNSFGEYLFEENGKRIRENAFNRKLTRICEAVHIPKRSMHKIRKTYGTSLINGHVDERLILDQMGHGDIRTTKQFYYFSNRDEAEKRKQIQNAIPY